MSARWYDVTLRGRSLSRTRATIFLDALFMFRDQVVRIVPCPWGIKAAPKTPPNSRTVISVRQTYTVCQNTRAISCESTVSVARRDVNQSLRNVRTVDEFDDKRDKSHSKKAQTLCLFEEHSIRPFRKIKRLCKSWKETVSLVSAYFYLAICNNIVKKMFDKSNMIL